MWEVLKEQLPENLLNFRQWLQFLFFLVVSPLVKDPSPLPITLYFHIELFVSSWNLLLSDVTFMELLL